jgi:hypothetical protein
MVRPSRDIVETILEVSYCLEKRFPPVLVLSAEGQVPTEGWSDALLRPRADRPQPIDGVWEFELSAVPPSPSAARKPSVVSADYHWDGFDQGRVLGCRVYGIGEGVKDILLSGQEGPGRGL